MQITVTAEHIKNGVRKTACECPIALALREKFYDAHVTSDIVQIKKKENDYWHEYRPAQRMIIFINHFDQGLTVVPTELEMRKLSF